MHSLTRLVNVRPLGAHLLCDPWLQHIGHAFGELP
jgi:hypothetical protein